MFDGMQNTLDWLNWHELKQMIFVEHQMYLFEQGGPVIILLFGLAAMCFFMLIEKCFYLFFRLPKQLKPLIERWNDREDKISWRAQAIRDLEIYNLTTQISKYLTAIKTCMSLFPMLGLLGTVFGMIGLFETLASNAKLGSNSMMQGITQATLPTLTGVCLTLLGMFSYTRVTGLCQQHILKLHQAMKVE